LADKIASSKPKSEAYKGKKATVKEGEAKPMKVKVPKAEQPNGIKKAPKVPKEKKPKGEKQPRKKKN